MTRLAYATYVGRDRHEGGDDEAPLVLAALAERGVDAVAAAWDDPAVDWGRFDVVLVRSTWDYATRRDDYLAWARLASRKAMLLNPLPVIERNTDKTYLRDLGDAVVPTTWVAPGESVPALLPGELVVKPTVSAAARDTLRSAEPAEVRSHVERLLAGDRTVMVQPYLPEVDAEGELSLVHLGGRFSHAVRKSPALSRAYDERDTRPVEADASLRAFAEGILDTVPEPVVYARVDCVRVGGRPLLMELELTEPYLYLRYADGAVERLADAVVSALPR